MTPQEYILMLALIEKAKMAAMIAVRRYSPPDAPYVEVTDFDEAAIQMMGQEGWPGSPYHIVYLPVETILTTT